MGCERHINLKRNSQKYLIDKLELFFPHLMFTLSLSDSKQQRERNVSSEQVFIGEKIFICKEGYIFGGILHAINI